MSRRKGGPSLSSSRTPISRNGNHYDYHEDNEDDDTDNLVRTPSYLVNNVSGLELDSPEQSEEESSEGEMPPSPTGLNAMELLNGIFSSMV